MSYWSQELDAYLKRTKLTRRQLALELGISINTLEKWWGHREPSPEHATRIRQLLQEDTPTTTTAFDKSFTTPGQDTVSIERVIQGKQTNEANFNETPLSNRGATDFPADVAGDELMAGQLSREFPKKGERYEERSVVISLLRTKCPFCEHAVDKFRNCVYCGQHFAWANVPMENDKPL